ncbi:Receptor-like kinase [Quillaja saponaria]|uniref:Receptor-like kinase n=1 Tax=Quillaja saponaria TaxID=32244 RepID=A0AAD7Q3Q3_QUISA|nr:Receptor-like kinase [Quillaja saponaria]
MAERGFGENQLLFPKPMQHPQQDKLTPPLMVRQSSNSQVPYSFVVISYSEFTYYFNVTDGPKFVRLYFYPDSFPDIERSNALFSVKSGTFTLLKDFNASLTADANQDKTIFREYCINVDQGQRLIYLTFIRSKTNPHAYAFINAIEILSMPTNFYYTKPSDPEGDVFINQNSGYTVGLEAALQLEYRINVGGRTIPSERDTTGMFRLWANDDDYVKVERPESLPADWGGTLRWNEQTPNYTAPDPVYLTARSYGMNETEKYNVTWEFPVDSEFTYMLRLHFCEFEPQIQQIGDRVFQIFIADGLAEDLADIILWSGGNLVPVYKDYVVRMSTGGGGGGVENSSKKLNLTIKMQPHPNERIRKYDDVLLNGVEIFKLSDPGSNSLAGSNPNPRPRPPMSNKKKTTTIVIPCVVSGAVFLSIIIVAFLRVKVTAMKDKSAVVLVTCIKGAIDDGRTPVAIKRLKPGSQQGVHEFKTEIEMLSQLRHLHLVSLIGYCNDNNEMILVYDYMTRGTFRDHLYNTDNPLLTWKQRLQICTGAARGLHYLHTGVKHKIIHRDVKSTNILLDKNWVAKISDFGLSKFGSNGISKDHVSTVVKGSIGYLDPEYYRRQWLTEKSDVYSFGVVLLETLCARPPVIDTVDKMKVSLAEWARQCHDNNTLHEMVDPNLKDKIAEECLMKFGEIALSCLVDDGTQRPSMNDVVSGLELALKLQENAEDGTCSVVGAEYGRKSWTEDAFSELLDPEGR